MSIAQRRARAPVALAIAAAALALAAPAANAHHSASATASLSLEPASTKCKQSERSYRSRCNGSRVASVAWSVSCAHEAIVNVQYLAARPGGQGPTVLETDEISGSLSGVSRTKIEAGTRVQARTVVYCDAEGDGDTLEAHRVKASSELTPEVLIPPRLVAIEVVQNTFCGFVPTNRQLFTTVQAGQQALLDLDLAFNDRSLLGVGRRRPAGVRRMALFASPALAINRRPRLRYVDAAGGISPLGAGIVLKARRPKWLRVWAKVGGIETNSLALRVFPARRC